MLTALYASAAGLIFLGCVSTSTAPANLSAGTCMLDARFPGPWKSARSSQLGPASMRFSFSCNCTYEARSRILLVSIREKGSYLANDGQLTFSRASGQVTTWPFRFEGDRLILQEGTDESRSYQRTKQRHCPNGTKPS